MAPAAHTDSSLAHIAEPVRHLAVSIETLTLDPANARKHDQRNLDAIAGSLKRFGQRFPIVVQRQGMVVRAGNGRLIAAKAMGWTHIAALVVDESEVAQSLMGYGLGHGVEKALPVHGFSCGHAATPRPGRS